MFTYCLFLQICSSHEQYLWQKLKVLFQWFSAEHVLCSFLNHSHCTDTDFFLSEWVKCLLFNQGTKPGQEGGVDLGIETIQFGAPASSGSDNEVGPVLSEKSTDKLPEPKEQRQKQPRAGPIKAQKVKSHNFSTNL